MSRVFGLTVAVAMAVIGFASSASAGDTIQRDVQVSYSDLNIKTETGASVLLDRIYHAARQACGGSPFMHPMYNVMPSAVTADFAKCYHNAVVSAVDSVGSPVVAAVYARKGEPSFRRLARD
jgi:UrcA family protein